MKASLLIGHFLLCDYRYETSSDVLVEPKDQQHWHQEGRLFRHHAKHSTYTITFCCRQQMEAGAKTDGGGSCCVQEEVEELRRLIQLHRKTKVSGRITCPLTSQLLQHHITSSSSDTDVDDSNINATFERA